MKINLNKPIPQGSPPPRNVFIAGLDFISEMADRQHFEAHCIFNEQGISFFQRSLLHNEASAWPLIFDYNHKGNAVAGVIKPGRLETMFHTQFPDNRIAKIWRTLRHDARLKFLADWRLTYQGRHVSENFV